MTSLKSNILENNFSQRLYLLLGLSPLALASILGVIILFLFPYLPPKLPLFYSLPWGEQQLVSHQQFFILPASMSLITFFNLIISWHLHPSQLFLKRVLILSSSITTLILLITFIKIVSIFI